jgi:acetylornithine deacetylase/succinyl-diaminopimelate desuccinylase-like protein
MMADLVRRIGDDLAPYAKVNELRWAHGIDQPLEGAAWDAMRGALLAADPEAVIVPILAPWSTDAKHTARIDVPTFGFSPLRLGPQDSFLDLAHADDERCPIEGLQWGLGVFADAIERFCG